jgi:hypothetical protein
MVIRIYLRLVKSTLGPSLLSSCYFSIALFAVLRELKGSPGRDKCTGPHEYSDHHDRRSNGFYPGDPDRARLNALFGGINERRENSLRGSRIFPLANRVAVTVAKGLVFHNRFRS